MPPKRKNDLTVDGRSSKRRYNLRSSAGKRNTAFTYSPFDTERKEIRLIRILPPSLDHTSSDDADTLSCTIEHVSMEDKPEYAALSYVWGNANDCLPILLNGTVCYITRNLEAALRQLRDQEMPLEIWADALCVNQNDDIEKTVQVSCMRDIYQESSILISWLGEATEGTETVFRWMNWAIRDMVSSEIYKWIKDETPRGQRAFRKARKTFCHNN